MVVGLVGYVITNGLSERQRIEHIPYVPTEGKDVNPVKRISPGEPGARGLQHSKCPTS